MRTAAYEEVFGSKVARRKRNKRRRPQQVQRLERRVTRRLELKHDNLSVKAVVACGRALKACVKVARAEKLAAGQKFSKYDLEGTLDDWDLRAVLENKASVRRRAAKELAKIGVKLTVGSYMGRVRFRCDPDRL